MPTFQLAAVFLALVALGGWLNARTFKLPHAVAMLIVGLTGAVTMAVARQAFPEASAIGAAITTVAKVDFSHAVLDYMLAFLLFAGAMQVDLSELKRQWLSVWTLATLGVAASTVIVGGGLYLAGRLLGVELPLVWAMVFGALISPTDPIAVLATVKGGHLSKRLQVVLQGEALFNDGVGIVVFTALLALATGASPSPSAALMEVAVAALGGLALGVAAGWGVIRAMRAIDDFAVEVCLSLALAMGVYAGAQALHLSGPIAVVGAGLLMGEGRHQASSDMTQAYLDNFWTLVDEVLNALLFFLLGLQLLVVPLAGWLASLCAAAIVLVLAARFAVVLPWGSYFHRHREDRGASLILTWGGLHGALSLALALSIPPGPERTVILAVTFVVATFSVLAQGLSFNWLAATLRSRSRAAHRAASAGAAEG